jgi:threonine dehydrogenase-like Zn-dependent dehydrogenase
MKTAAITGRQECAIRDVPEPSIKANYCKVKIVSAPLCTEFYGYRKGDASESLGHEAAGEVVETAQTGMFAPGERVVVMPQNGCGKCPLCLSGNHIHCRTPRDPFKICGTSTGRATIAQYCIQQDWLLVKIPDGMPYDHAAMACCGLGPTFGAMQLMNVSAFDTVVVAGLGPVGLGGVINASHRGARVIGIEKHPYRAELAKRLGAEEVIDPTDPDARKKVLDLTSGRGADACVETANAAESPLLLMDVVRPKGQIAFVSWTGKVDVPAIVGKGLTLHGAWHWNHLQHGERMFHVIRQNPAKLDTLITHTFPLSRIKEAFEIQLTGRCGKIVLHPWD